MRPRMIAPLIGGLGLFGFGEGLLVASHWGATPWTVFAQGLGNRIGISLGWSTLLISAVVLLAWWPLREKPGLGTVANLAIIAYALDVTAANIATPSSDALRAVLMVSGVAAIGIGSALYLTTGLGPGPRDGVMTSLHRRLNVSVVYVRLSIEVTVLIVGWLLGGVVGIGTAFFAAAIGFSIGLNLNFLDRLVKKDAP
jgi:uncharacterized membrane protein YczE